MHAKSFVNRPTSNFHWRFSWCFSFAPPSSIVYRRRNWSCCYCFKRERNKIRIVGFGFHLSFHSFSMRQPMRNAIYRACKRVQFWVFIEEIIFTLPEIGFVWQNSCHIVFDRWIPATNVIGRFYEGIVRNFMKGSFPLQKKRTCMKKKRLYARR